MRRERLVRPTIFTYFIELIETSVASVACFNIVSTLVMAVKDKSGDIAVLRTLGAKDGLIRAIFVWYGLLAGLFGSLCGVIIGVVVSLQPEYGAELSQLLYLGSAE